MTFQRKLLLGFSLTAIPVLLIAAEAIRINLLERAALETLGENMARNRTYGELEDIMSKQTDAVWRYLTGMSPEGRKEYQVTGQVINYWQQRWQSELRPDERGLADTVRALQNAIDRVVGQVFTLYDSGQRVAAYQLATRDLRNGLMPILADVNRDVYRRQRESSVRGAYAELAAIVAGERRTLIAMLVLALGTGVVASWLIARGLTRPIRALNDAMVAVGAGNLTSPIDVTLSDEVGTLARAFAQMTEKLRLSRAELDAKQAQLVQSERLALIGEMAAAVAHGLRNPLASLRAAAQLGLHRAAVPDAREHFQTIIDEVDRLDRRVGHLLSFSRPAPFHPLRENVATLVDDLLPAVAGPMREHGITLDMEVAATLPPIRVDPMQIEQALLEIIANAIDAMPGPEGGRLRIAARSDDSGITVEISDTGRGIPESVLPSVCEPFFTTRPEGTGLGLAIAKRYVEQNGGRLAIASRHGEGGGTTARVWLPAETAA